MSEFPKTLEEFKKYLAEREATTLLFRVEDVPDGGSAGFVGVMGFPEGLLAVRRGDKFFVYINYCPHQGKPLDWNPGEFLNYEKDAILCEAHGALFRIEDGHCFDGPCTGQGLAPVPIEIRDGAVYAINAA